MKCLAAQQNYSKKVSQLTEKYGTWILEFIDTIFGVVLVTHYKFGTKRLQEFFDEGRGGLIEAVNRYCPDSMLIKTRQGMKKADENTRLSDAVDLTLDKFTQELEAIGFIDLNFVALEPTDDFSLHWHKAIEFSTYKTRRTWYDTTGARAIKIYVVGIMLYMNERHGFGAGRLNELYDKTAAYIQSYIERFLKSSISEDQRLMSELDKLHSVLAEKGIELIDLPDEDKIQVKNAKKRG